MPMPPRSDTLTFRDLAAMMRGFTAAVASLHGLGYALMNTRSSNGVRKPPGMVSASTRGSSISNSASRFGALFCLLLVLAGVAFLSIFYEPRLRFLFALPCGRGNGSGQAVRTAIHKPIGSKIPLYCLQVALIDLDSAWHVPADGSTATARWVGARPCKPLRGVGGWVGWVLGH